MNIQLKRPASLDERIKSSVEYGKAFNTSGYQNSLYCTVGKSLLDYFVVILSLPIVLPLVGIFALLIVLTGGQPFYWQNRLDKNGNIFKILKLRTMVRNADDVLEDYLAANPDAKHEWDCKQKLRNDPRVTRVGKFLRKTSLDELPQIWNILKGEMSLIGPRPMMVDQKALYPGTAYFRIRPGITGLWQVSERNETSFSERAAYDTKYYKELSLKTDLSILVRTVGVVLHGTGC